MKWLKNIWSPKNLVVVFIRIDSGEMSCTPQLFGKRKKEFGSFDDIEEMVKEVGKSRGYHFHIQGQGVLTRKVEALPNYKEQLVIGGNANDFYFTSLDDGVHVSSAFVRKSVVEEWQILFEEKKWHLLGVSCGEIPLCWIDENAAYSGDMHIRMESGHITKLERNTALEKLSYSDEIGTSLLRQYTDEDERASFDQFEEATLNYKEFTQFKVLGLGLLFGLLFFLVGNYFYQNYLNQSIAQLEMDLTLSNENLQLLDRLDQEKSRKEQLIANAGVTSPKFLSYYLDEIGTTVPKTVDLQELYVFPLDGKLKNKQKVTIHSDRIVIHGTSPDNVTLDDWIEYMDRFEWIQSIELLHYGKVSDKQAEFEIEITLTA